MDMEIVIQMKLNLVQPDIQIQKTDISVQRAVLKKLGVNPLESLIKIHIAWADGELIPAEVLYMNLEAFQQEVASAYLSAQKLALELGIIDDETINPLLQKGYREAIAVLFELPMIDETMLDEYIRRAERNAKLINSMVFGEGIQEPKKDDDKDKGAGMVADKDEEEEGVGIGGLFG